MHNLYHWSLIYPSLQKQNSYFKTKLVKAKGSALHQRKHTFVTSEDRRMSFRYAFAAMPCPDYYVPHLYPCSLLLTSAVLPLLLAPLLLRVGLVSVRNLPLLPLPQPLPQLLAGSPSVRPLPLPPLPPLLADSPLVRSPPLLPLLLLQPLASASAPSLLLLPPLALPQPPRASPSVPSLLPLPLAPLASASVPPPPPPLLLLLRPQSLLSRPSRLLSGVTRPSSRFLMMLRSNSRL